MAAAHFSAPIHEDPSTSKVARTWRVIHACDSIRSVADLVEAQIAAGMRPFVLTGQPARNASLLDAWALVRSWKNQLEEADAPSHPLHASITHCHNFAAAMAALRAGLTTVYDVSAFVEDHAVAAGHCTERSWLARSFRAAEEFVLRRADAVVVHSGGMQAACLKREVEAANLFVVPAPMQPPVPPDTGWLRRAFDFSEEVVTIFARPSAAEDETLVRAFAQVVAEVPGARLFLAASPEQAAQLRRFAHQHEVEEDVFFLAPEDEGPALQAADIVLAGRPIFPDDSSWGRMNALAQSSNGTALSAMANGRCLLAADCGAHRDLSPDGRGCLWFGAPAETKDHAVELAQRMAFLARNGDFRRALGDAGRQHLTETRDPERIGKMYREVYWHAHLRHRRGDDAQGQTPILIPAQNAV